MKEDLNDIFVVTGQCPAQQQLLNYVQGKLSAAEQHEVEKHVADCELCSDALEGLAAIPQKERLPVMVRQMKWQLLRKLRKKNHRRRAADYPVDYYIQLVLIVMAVLFLVLAAFWMMHFMLK
ncbi:zf-HC2 domain-containing protein [Chitinophaga rupis]|uniref:zf-HC2 domain-containing protein n=1 Tax=Chitinophaga rupis TaxID=573321 RepID=UPI00138FF09E|nr:zf-HC2 domain-containing protein [Chitinophaga rupis]